MLTITIGRLISTGLFLGIGLTMDAAAVSMANGLQEPNMKPEKHMFIAFMYGIFQGFMPLLGYFCGYALYKNFPQIQEYHLIPICALIILGYLGTKMIIDGIKENKNIEIEEEYIKAVSKPLTIKLIFIQAIATSIDALSSGLSFANYEVWKAIVVTSIVAFVTFIVSYISVIIGKKFGNKLGSKAIIVGGIVLVIIGLEIFITGLIGA